MESDGRLAQMERVRYITRNFRSFQGYRLLVWVPAFVLWTGSEAGILRGDWWLWAFSAAIAAGFAGWAVVDHWYRRTYGNVQRVWDRWHTLTVLGLAGLAVVGFVAGTAGWRWPDHVVSWEGGLIGAAYVVFGWQARAAVPARLWAGVVVAVLSVLPLGMLGGGVHPFGVDGAVPFLVTVLVTVDGIASHVALGHMLGAGGAAPETS